VPAGHHEDKRRAPAARLLYRSGRRGRPKALARWSPRRRRRPGAHDALAEDGPKLERALLGDAALTLQAHRRVSGSQDRPLSTPDLCGPPWPARTGARIRHDQAFRRPRNEPCAPAARLIPNWARNDTKPHVRDGAARPRHCRRLKSPHLTASSRSCQLAGAAVLLPPVPSRGLERTRAPALPAWPAPARLPFAGRPRSGPRPGFSPWRGQHPRSAPGRQPARQRAPRG
jgi:hypothetical protein